MHLNEFSLGIREDGNPLTTVENDGYVALKHKTIYSLVMKNHRAERCDARVEIDGKPQGVYRIGGHSTFVLERGLEDTGRFTFYALDSQEAQEIGLGLVPNEKLGLISVTFIPEFPLRPHMSEERSPWRDIVKGDPIERGGYRRDDAKLSYRGDSGAKGMGAGGTGLSGWSSQKFVEVGELDADKSQTTVIFLRLVEDKPKARPLKSVGYSTPIPRPVI